MLPLRCFRSGLVAGAVFSPMTRTFKPVRFAVAPKAAQGQHAPAQAPLEAVKGAQPVGGDVHYTRLIREWLERKARAVARLDPLQ